MKYTVFSPDGACTVRSAKEGMTHAVIRLFEGELFYRVSLASSLERAEREIKNKGGSQHTILVIVDSNGEGNATDQRYVVSEIGNNLPKAATPSPAQIWEEAFQAGKSYGLQCAFKGVTAPPANPYSWLYRFQLSMG